LSIDSGGNHLISVDHETISDVNGMERHSVPLFGEDALLPDLDLGPRDEGGAVYG